MKKIKDPIQNDSIIVLRFIRRTIQFMFVLMCLFYVKATYAQCPPLSSWQPVGTCPTSGPNCVNSYVGPGINGATNPCPGQQLCNYKLYLPMCQYPFPGGGSDIQNIQVTGGTITWGPNKFDHSSVPHPGYYEMDVTVGCGTSMTITDCAGCLDTQNPHVNWCTWQECAIIQIDRSLTNATSLGTLTATPSTNPLTCDYSGSFLHYDPKTIHYHLDVNSSIHCITSYVWTLPSGWSGSSTGTDIDITVGSCLGGTVSVVAQDACGHQSVAASITYPTPTAPPTPTFFTWCDGDDGPGYHDMNITNNGCYQIDWDINGTVTENGGPNGHGYFATDVLKARFRDGCGQTSSWATVIWASCKMGNPTKSKEEPVQQISESEFEKGLTIKPNPTSKEIKISLLDQKGVIEMNLVGLSGSVVKNIEPASKEVTVNISDLPSGTYYLVIRTSAYQIIRTVNIVK